VEKKNALWRMFEIPRKSMQRETFFWLDICVAKGRWSLVKWRGQLGKGKGERGGTDWLRGIWQSQRQHAANGRRKLYAKTMTKHTRQTESQRDRQTDEWETTKTERQKEKDGKRGPKSEKRMPTICIQCKATDKVSFFPLYFTFFSFSQIVF